ncbi:MAG: hypothetical protein ABI347_03180 [Nitrososphaera sp.]|jgi:hypothetical protein
MLEQKEVDVDDDDNIIYRSLLQSLSVLGPTNAGVIKRMLQEQGVIRDGVVDTERLWESLE